MSSSNRWRSCIEVTWISAFKDKPINVAPSPVMILQSPNLQNNQPLKQGTLKYLPNGLTKDSLKKK